MRFIAVNLPTMYQFSVKCGKENVPVKFCIGLLCVTYKGKNYLIEHREEDGWLLKLDTMPADVFARITEAIEEFICEDAAK
jgi:hypothetical protein